jgi:hypothetical protein
MKIVATTLLVIGLIAFFASSTLFAYHFATVGDPTMGDGIAMAASGIVACIALFIRSRAVAGIPTLAVTDTDRAELQNFRREFGIRKILAQIIGTFAGLCFVAGFMSLFNLDERSRADRHTAVVLIVFSQILIFCVWLLVRKKNDLR